MRMAPKPIRLTVTSPPSRTVPLEPAGRLLGLSFMLIPPESFLHGDHCGASPVPGGAPREDAVAVEAPRVAAAGTSARAEMSAGRHSVTTRGRVRTRPYRRVAA